METATEASISVGCVWPSDEEVGLSLHCDAGIPCERVCILAASLPTQLSDNGLEKQRRMEFLAPGFACPSPSCSDHLGNESVMEDVSVCLSFFVTLSFK